MVREVFFAEPISACLRSGKVVRGSFPSALRPPSSSSLAAPSATATMLLVATMVTSVPARFTSATPKGIVYSSAGTGPFTRYIILSSKMTTGLSSRMAVFISPLASYGPDGSATLRPGMWLTQAWSDCECWAADRRVAPHLLRDRFLDRLAVRQLTHAHDSSVSIRCVGTTKRWMGTPCGQAPWHGWPEQERQGAAPAESMAYSLLASFRSP